MSSLHRLVNTTSRPVELHLPSGSIVIEAHGEASCDEADLELGHVRALCESRVLVARPVEDEPKPAPARKPRKTSTATRTRKQPQKRSASSTRRRGGKP
jgi:hypothetical protein